MVPRTPAPGFGPVIGSTMRMNPRTPAYLAPLPLLSLCPPRMPLHPAARALLEYLIEIQRVTYAFELGPRLVRAYAGLDTEPSHARYAYV